MSFHRWLKNRRSAVALSRSRRRHQRQRSLRSITHRLTVESLEDRRLLTFSPAVDYPVGLNPQAVVAGYFNNDAVLDLAVANGNDNSLSILLGNPDGTFAMSGNYVTGGGSPRSIAVGDFDADTFLDLATANDSDVSILPGNGDGTFGTPTNIDISELGGGSTSAAVGDFNGDGLLDLGVTSHTYYPGYCYYGCSPGYYIGHANVLLGNGDGSFSGPLASWLGIGYYTSVAVADFDSDGIDDFAASNTESSTVTVAFGSDSGYLERVLDLPTGYHPYSITVADVDGNSHADVLTANLLNDSVSVMLGDGTGGFGATHNYATGASPNSVAVADFNDDNVLDIVTSSNWYTGGISTGQVHVLLGLGDGEFAGASGQSLATGTYAVDLAVGDFDGDRLADVAVVNSVTGSGNVSVLINAGEWTIPSELSIKDVTVTEGDAGTVAAMFVVTRNGNLDGAVTVNYGTANGGALAASDYVASSGMLTFAPNEPTKTITILVNGDVIDEYDQDFYVNLSNAVGANIVDSQGVGTIVDNDAAPTITITAKVSAKEGNNNSTKSFDFIVTLSAPSEKEVRVNFATANGTATTADSDYVARSGTLIFSPGQTSKTISVIVKGDKKKEANETFFVNLSSATNASILRAQGTGEILDDDAPGSGNGKP